MNNFEYAIPESLDKALEYLEVKQSRVKAGGIDLLDQMKEGLVTPVRLVNIRDLADLKFIKRESGSIDAFWADPTIHTYVWIHQA